jgi:hypothetical protein
MKGVDVYRGEMLACRVMLRVVHASSATNVVKSGFLTHSAEDARAPLGDCAPRVTAPAARIIGENLETELFVSSNNLEIELFKTEPFRLT